MQRILVLGSGFLFCVMLVGCGPDSREGLIDDTITMIEHAATDVGTIKSRVNDAVKKAEEKGTKLDLTDAGKAADQLKKIGDEAQKIKRRIEQERATITDSERETFITNKRDGLKRAFETLVKQKTDLNTALAKAEQLSQAAKDAVDKLRDKIRDAESPFESLAR